MRFIGSQRGALRMVSPNLPFESSMVVAPLYSFLRLSGMSRALMPGVSRSTVL